MTNEIAKTEGFKTKLAKVNDTYLPMITNQLQGNGVNMSDYQKQCVMNALAEINNTLEQSNMTISNVDQQILTQILLQIASLQLNATATPREVYFMTRKKKVGNTWATLLEMGIEGDGNDAILSRFGRGIKQVHKFWEVREHDGFTYPKLKGLETTPPEWEPTGKGKVVRIVYPVSKTDGTVEYLIAERDDVVRNLSAHISNNLMTETFGIAKSKYDATPEQKKQIDEKKKEVKDLMKDKSLEDLLATDDLSKYISPAWKEPQSRESMIVRKMRNNLTKKYPKNFENAYVAMNYETATDETVKTMRKDVSESANTIEFETEPDVEPTVPAYDVETGEIQEEINEPVQENNEAPTEQDPF